MSQPPAYTRSHSFTDYQTSNPTTPLPGPWVDSEYNALQNTLTQLLANLALIQRDDGQLANASVGNDQLQAGLVIGINEISDWATGQVYIITDAVWNLGILYRCLVPHTSGVFATDLSAGDWGVVFNATENLQPYIDELTAAATAALATIAADTTTCSAAVTSTASSQTAAAASATTAATAQSAASASATAAATSATAAATSETLAAAGNTWWKRSNNNTMGDPTTGLMSLNNSTISSVTQIAISAQVSNTGNSNLRNYINTWDDSTSPVHGTIIITNVGVPGSFAIFQVSGTITDNTTWLQIPVTYVTGNGTYSPNDTMDTRFYRTGDAAASTAINIAASSTPAVNLSLGSVFTYTPSATSTFSFTNPASSGTESKFKLYLTQNATAKTIVWPASVVWNAGAAPFIGVNSGRYAFEFSTIDGGTTYYGNVIGQPGGEVLISKQIVSGTPGTITFGSANVLPFFDNYKIKAYGVSSSTGADLTLDMAIAGTYGGTSYSQLLTINSGGTGTYSSGGVSVVGLTHGSSLGTNPVGRAIIDLLGVTSNLQTAGHANTTSGTVQVINDFIVGTAAVYNGIQLAPSAGTFTAGVFELYGQL